MSRRYLIVLLAVASALLVLAVVRGLRQTDIEQNVANLAPPAQEVHLKKAPNDATSEFPAIELRSALADSCLSDSPLTDGKEWTAEEMQAVTDALIEQRRSTSKQLSKSLSIEHLHLAALLEDDSALQIDLLRHALSQSPNNPFLLWRAVQICTEVPASPACKSAEWERQLLIVDSQNSESWVRIAANRYKAGELDAALEAMRHAASSPETRLYWVETMEMAERGLAASASNFEFSDRARMAFSITMANLPQFIEFTTMCSDQSSRNAEWAQLCFAYGELTENQGKTEIGVSIGRTIQKSALEALGEREKAAAVAARMQARRKENMDSVKNYDPATDRLIFSNPTLFSAYLAAVRSDGETAALRQIRRAAEQLLLQQPELACELM